MYGDGFTVRSARYTSNGCASVSREKRCDTWIWYVSPRLMYSFARSTFAMKPSRVLFDANARSACDVRAVSYGSRESGLASRLTSSSIFHVACRYDASTSPSSRAWLTTLILCCRWSKTSSVSMNRKIASGKPCGSASGTGSFS